MNQRTPLYDCHLAAGAHMVPFGGWDMPLHYGGQIEEHHAVRRRAGLFDVSHMAVVDVRGAGATDYLRHLLANDVARLAPGQALYTCMLNERGGVVDDLIVYRRPVDAPAPYRLVVNAATRDKDLHWFATAATGRAVSLEPRNDLAMLAVQGPAAVELAAPLLPVALRAAAPALRPFHAIEDATVFVARTGYTGEDGFELMVAAGEAAAWWDRLMAAGVAPCGLGARDTLRLEAGMNLYGQDMDEEHSPLVSGLGWTVAWEPAARDFIGREALERERAAGPAQRLAGLVLEERGVMRRDQRVITGAGEGIITSGGFAPTLNRSVAFARVPADAAGDCQVEIRGVLRPARLVRPPFARQGRALIADAS
ncbi:MAG: glycine cleavage system aminomethyltransferase GcvT [Gammaproteobacteria bacterium]|nr:glycine cleavage system aminomethyltransferase GcvT [Gammaproteobacteria bacterium]